MQNKILNQIKDIVDDDSLTQNQKLEDIQDWDSLAKITFVSWVDQNLKITLYTQDLQECQTIADIISLLESKCGK